MTELETRLGEAWRALEVEAGAAAFRLLTVFAGLAQRPADGWSVFRANREAVLAGLEDLERKRPSDDSLRQRIRTICATAEVIAEAPDHTHLAFRLQSERSMLVLRFVHDDGGFATQLSKDRAREATIGSTKATIATLGVSLQEPRAEPAEPTFQVFVSRGPTSRDAQKATNEFLDDLEQKLEATAANRELRYKVRLWWAPRDLATAADSDEDQARTACDQSRAMLLLLGDGWPDSGRFARQAARFHEAGELTHGDCIKVVVAGNSDRSSVSAGPVLPELWASQKDRRTPDGKGFVSLLQLWTKGDADDRESFVSHVRDELLALLDRVVSGEAQVDRARLQRDKAARAFEAASRASYGREIAGPLEEARASRAEGEGNPEDLLPVLEAWALRRGIDSRIFALLGSFGTGKTTAAHMFAQRLVALREVDPSTPFPVLLDLRRLADLFAIRDGRRQMTLAELMVSSLDPEHARDIDAAGLLDVLRSEPCVIIFDGIDEVGTRLGVERTAKLFGQLLDVVPKEVWNREAAAGSVDWGLCGARIMATCRTQFFETYIQQRAILTGHHRHASMPVTEGGTHATTYYMAPLRPEQVRDYFCESLGAERGGQVFQAVAGVGELEDLARKPLMTRFIAEQAPKLLCDIAEGRPINAGRLYQHLFEEALARDGYKQTAMTVRDRQDLLESLAEEFWRRQTPVLELHHLERWFDRYMAGSIALGNILRSGGNARALLLTELRNASLLMRATDDAFGFDHTSFFEYFLARRLITSLIDGEFDPSADCPPVSELCVSFMRDHIVSEGLGEAFGRALDRVFLGGAVQARALAAPLAIMLCTLLPTWSYPVGANLSNLDFSSRSFNPVEDSRRRLSKVSFAKTSLLNATVREIDFDQCDFEAAIFWSCWFEDCSFVGCTGKPIGTGATRVKDCEIDASSESNLFKKLVFRYPNPGFVPDPTCVRNSRGHLGAVNSAVFSPDGSQVLTASDDRTARLFDRASGAEITRFSGHSGWVNQAVFSPEGNQVLTAGKDGTARLFDRASGAEIARFSSDTSWLFGAVFSPDGSQVLTAGADGTVRTFDKVSEAEIARFSGHEDWIRSVVFSPDGSQVLTAGKDGTARLFDCASGAEIARFSGHEDWVNSAVFSPDGSQVLTASDDRTARLFDRASGAEIARFSGHERELNSAEFSPDGSQVLTAGKDGTARMFDRASGAEIARFSGQERELNSAVFSPDGSQVLTAGEDNTTRLFDRASGAEIARFSGQEDWVRSAVFSPDGSQVLTASNDGTARLFDRPSGAEVARFSGQEYWVNGAVFSPDGNLVLTAGSDGTARIFDRASGAEIARFSGHQGWLHSAVLSPDGSQVLTAGEDGTTRLFDRASGAEIARFSGHEGWVNSAVFSPDGSQVLTAGKDGTVRLFDRASGAEIASFSGHEDWVNSAVFSPDGSQVLTAGEDGTARLFDRASGAEIASFSSDKSWLFGAVFSPDGSQVLTAGADGTVRTFDKASGAEIARFSGHEYWIRSVVFSPDGSQVLTASNDGTARLFDRASESLAGGWQLKADATLVFDGSGDVVTGDGATWKYVYGFDMSFSPPKVVCVDVPQARPA